MKNYFRGENMKKVAKFEKVSFEKFYESCMMHHMTVEDIHKSYNSLKIPKRATKGSPDSPTGNWWNI